MSKSIEIPPPRQTADLRGHLEGRKRLLEALRSGRLPHAWLITGPRGIGKATLAYHFARYLLAGAPEPGPSLFGGDDEADAMHLDPEHPVFRQVAAQAHPDLFVLQRRVDDKGRMSQFIAVEDVRRATTFMHMTSSEGSWRIVIVDAADDLGVSSANALLKILEEPPSNGLLLLVSHAPARLLATIRSRCCHLALKPLPDEDVRALLEVARPDTRPEEKETLIELSGGSIGRALALDEAGGVPLLSRILELLGSLPHLDVKGVHELGDQLGGASEAERFRTGMQLFSWWLARFVHGVATGRRPGEIVEGEADLMARLGERASLAEWHSLWEKIDRLAERTERANLDRKQAVISAFTECQAVTGTAHGRS